MSPRLSKFTTELKMFWGVAKTTFTEQWQIDRGLLVGTLALVPINALAPLLSSFLAGQAINQLVAALGHHTNPNRVYTTFALAGIAGLATTLISPLQRYFRAAADVKTELFLERRMNEAVLSVDVPTLESPRFVELFNKTMYRHVFAHQRVINQSLQVATNILTLLGSAFVLARISPWLLPVLLVAIVPSVAASFYVGRLRDQMVWNDPENFRSAERRTSRYMANEDTNIEIRLNTAQTFFLNLAERFRKTFAMRELEANRKSVRLNTMAAVFEDIIFLGVQLALVARVIAGKFGIGTYTFYFQTIQRFGNSSSTLFNNASRIYEDALVLRDFHEILAIKPVIVSKRGAIKLPPDKVPEIVFDKVSFSYPDAPKSALHEVSLTIKPGEKVGFVGENGAGKTTIIKLLARMYEPTSGAIYIDGHNLADLDLASWHDHLGALMQHYGRYIYDVRTNVGVGRHDEIKNDDRLNKAISQAEAGAVLKELPKGLDQPLATMFKDGVNLSGGQWQRLGLARALFRQANIVILDEPTAAVDARAEYHIFQQFLQGQKNKSVIIISHRFSTVRQADRIFVLENGTIIEEGSHKQLIARKGLYQKLFEMQAEGYR